MLKIAIILLLVALVASLGSGFYYLMLDQGDKTKRRTLHSLGFRVTIAVLLMGLIVYGVSTGQLGRGTPWTAGPTAQSSAAESTEPAEPTKNETPAKQAQ